MNRRRVVATNDILLTASDITVEITLTGAQSAHNGRKPLMY